jgi:membrane protein required for colicin V production
MEEATQAAQHASDFSWLDLSVLIMLLLSAILAFLRGFVREALSLVTWVGASAAALYLYPVAQPWMRQHIENAAIADAATGLAIFCIALILLIPLSMVIANAVKGNTLTAIDRSLGFVFGILRGVLVVCLLYLVALWIWPKQEMQPEWIQIAKTRPILESGAKMIQSFIPQNNQDDAKRAIDRADEAKKQLDAADKLLQQLTVPKPGTDKEQQPAYDTDQRQQLEQLIEKKSQ